MTRVELDSMRAWAGIGVAGNFAGHLEQAGEAGDFVGVVAAAESAPKGIFPFYVPGHDSFLAVFPLSRRQDRAAPAGAGRAAEPAVGAGGRARLRACATTPTGRSTALAPFAFGAFNDCSIRRPGAAKISEKKNWGACSKGVAPQLVRARRASLERARRPATASPASCAATGSCTPTASTARWPATPTTASGCSTGSSTASATSRAATARRSSRSAHYLARLRPPDAAARRDRRHPLHAVRRVDLPASPATRRSSSCTTPAPAAPRRRHRCCANGSAPHSR